MYLSLTMQTSLTLTPCLLTPYYDRYQLAFKHFETFLSGQHMLCYYFHTDMPIIPIASSVWGEDVRISPEMVFFSY